MEFKKHDGRLGKRYFSDKCTTKICERKLAQTKSGEERNVKRKGTEITYLLVAQKVSLFRASH